MGVIYCRCPQENRRREDLWRLQSHPESSTRYGPASTSKVQRPVCRSCRRQSFLKTWPHTGLPPNGGGGEIPALAHNHHSQRALSLSPPSFWHLIGPSSIPTDYGANPARDSRISSLHGRHRADRSNSRRTLGQTGPSTSAARGTRPQTAEVQVRVPEGPGGVPRSHYRQGRTTPCAGKSESNHWRSSSIKRQWA